jgi:hypothetical protein
MKLNGYLLAIAPITMFLATEAHAAVVAVMPVQGSNLSQGQADAIGMLFTSAFARETNVAVASPLETGPLLAQVGTAQAVAARLGAAEFVDLRAAQRDNRITLAGIRYGKDGNEVFRSETFAPSIDDMEAAAARLARSLAWRQPVAYAPGIAPLSPTADTSGPKSSSKAFGIKTGMTFPRSWSSSRTYAPMMSLQFDGRFGSRDSFIEIGAGAAVPTSSSSGTSDIQMGGVFAELGGSFYLSDGNIAPYLGGGVSPRVWIVDSRYGSDTSGATCAVYAQGGITFTRDSRAKLYTEFRITQYVLALSETNSSYYSSDYRSSSSSLYPAEFSLQFGIGW